jgi:hypothetical protein
MDPSSQHLLTRQRLTPTPLLALSTFSTFVQHGLGLFDSNLFLGHSNERLSNIVFCGSDITGDGCHVYDRYDSSN